MFESIETVATFPVVPIFFPVSPTITRADPKPLSLVTLGLYSTQTEKRSEVEVGIHKRFFVSAKLKTNHVAKTTSCRRFSWGPF